jgi:hypothetical protein
LKVQNHLGLEAVKAITFVPNLSVKTYMGERTGVAIVLGYQEKKTEYDLSLINGWTVKENTLICGDKHWGWGSAGCKFVNQAVPGSTRVISRTLIWIDCLGVVVSKNFLTIEGPSGLPPTQ